MKGGLTVALSSLQCSYNKQNKPHFFLVYQFHIHDHWQSSLYF